jgi:predicted nuclease of predicted toxin-antitoxin system
MKFKLDENLSHSVAELFRTAGHDVMTVRDQGLRGAPDEQMFEVSVREDRVLSRSIMISARCFDSRPMQAPE